MQWDDLMKSDKQTLSLICTRINGDFERMPAGRLRKSAGPDEVRQLQLVCRAFELCKAELIASVGQDVWDAHEALLRKKFLSKNMDTELEKMLEGWPIVDNKPHVDIAAVAEFGQILSQQVRDVEMQASSKANELKLKMETATHEQMVHALGNDEKKLCGYYVDLAKAKNAWGDLVLNHRRKRYLRGLKFAEKLMTKRFLTKVAVDFDHAQSEYIDLLEPVEKEVVTSGRGKTCTLVVTDLMHAPKLSKIEEMLKVGADLTHLNQKNALFVLYPLKHGSITTNSLLSTHRKIEDVLMAALLNIDMEVSYHFSITDSDHSGDKRPKHARGRLCISDKYDQSLWTQKSEVAVEIVPICKVRDMKIPPSKLKSGPADPSKLLSPGMRVQQKGRESATMIMSKFVQDSGLGKDDVLLVVDLNPGLVPEWAQATWSIFAEHLNGNNMPNAAWIGFAEDEGAKKDVDGFIEDMIITEHWDTHPDAGPKEPQQQVEQIIKPELEIASWHDNGGVTIPSILEGKFGDPSLHVQWMEVTKKFTAKMQGLMKEAGVQTSATA